eukprot:g4310.t1
MARNAAIRLRGVEEGILYLRDLEVVHINPTEPKPQGFVKCLYGNNKNNMRRGEPNLGERFRSPAIYLVPRWTPTKRLANITGFELVFTEVEDPNQKSLTPSSSGKYVYLKQICNPDIESRIIDIKLYRSKDCNIASQIGRLCTQNINEERDGDQMRLSWTLG